MSDDFWGKKFPKSDPEEAEDRADVTETWTIPQTYDPTRTTDPARPRTESAGYNAKARTLQVTFRRGAGGGGTTAVYNYYDVEPALWQQFKRSASPGKFINRRLAGKPYGRVG